MRQFIDRVFLTPLRASVATPLHTMWRRGRLAAQVARERRELAALPPHILRDLNIDPLDAQREAARDPWDLPAHRLSALQPTHDQEETEEEEPIWVARQVCAPQARVPHCGGRIDTPQSGLPVRLAVKPAASLPVPLACG